MTVQDIINELTELVRVGDLQADAKVCIVHADWEIKTIDFTSKDKVLIK